MHLCAGKAPAASEGETTQLRMRGLLSQAGQHPLRSWILECHNLDGYLECHYLEYRAATVPKILGKSSLGLVANESRAFSGCTPLESELRCAWSKELQSTQPGKPRWLTPTSNAFCSTCFTLRTLKSY